jgi:hypothetical protein
MTPSLARTLVNSWKSWCVVLLGMGLFNAVCRQVSPGRRDAGCCLLLGHDHMCMQLMA